MPLEAATYISQLVATNPASSDKKNVGDDHLRLIKSTVQATFPNASRPVRFREMLSKSIDYIVLATDDNKTILATTTAGAISLTLPTPTFGGWLVRVMKITTDVNPVFVLPPSGTINGLARARLNIPFVEYTFLWTGSTFIRLKAPGEPSAGSIEVSGKAAAPVGYGSPTGQSLLRVDYPELFEAWGETWGAVDGTHFTAPDLRGRAVVFTGGTFDLIETGGAETIQLAQVNLPAYNLPHQLTLPNHQHTDGGAENKNGTGPGSLGGQQWYANAGFTGSPTTANIPITGTVPLGGSNTPFNNMPPYVVMNPIFRLC